MSYFDHQQPQTPHQPTFRQEPVAPYPVDEDGDLIYTEEDYAIPADGDAFLPDEADDDAFYADPYAVMTDPYAAMADPYAADDPEAWDDDPDAPITPDMLTEEERAEMRRNNWRLLAGLSDFGAVILGTAVILVLVALLVSLLNWLVNDISQTFTLLQMQV